MPSYSFKNFSGGLNAYVSPHLLNPQFSTVLTDCCINNGSIIANKKDVGYDLPLGVEDLANLDYDYTVSISELGGLGEGFLRSNNDTGGVSLGSQSLVLPTPNQSDLFLNAEVAEQGVPAGVYKYIFRYVSVGNRVKSSFSIGSVIPKSITIKNTSTDTVISDDNSFLIVQLQNTETLFSVSTALPLSSVGSALVLQAVSSDGSKLESEIEITERFLDRRRWLSYITQAFATEHAGYIHSGDVGTTSNQTLINRTGKSYSFNLILRKTFSDAKYRIFVSGYIDESFEGSYEIFRTVSGGSTFFLNSVVNDRSELSVRGNREFMDITDDIVLSTKEVADTINITTQDPYEKGKFLIDNNVLWLAVGNNVHYSRVDSLLEFRGTNTLFFEYVITGMISVDESIVVFTNQSTHLIRGFLPETVSVSTISSTVGLKDYKTLRPLRQNPVWFFEGDLYSYGLYTERSGRAVTNLSEQVLEFKGNIIGSVGGVDSYFLLTDETSYEYNVRIKPTFTEVTEVYNSGANIDNVTVFKKANNTLVMHGGSAITETVRYRSVAIHFGYIDLYKSLHRLSIDCGGSPEITIEYGDNKKWFFKLPEGENSLYLPNFLISTIFYLNIKTQGDIVSYSLVYKLFSRNG